MKWLLGWWDHCNLTALAGGTSVEGGWLMHWSGMLIEGAAGSLKRKEKEIAGGERTLKYN
jgi:hypothetical protein